MDPFKARFTPGFFLTLARQGYRVPPGFGAGIWHANRQTNLHIRVYQSSRTTIGLAQFGLRFKKQLGIILV
jgi:hypothetical protein